MKTPEERRFERIKDILIAESSGSGPVKIASTRTLFGIKSHAEEVIERTVAEMEADSNANLKQDSRHEADNKTGNDLEQA